MNTITHIKDNLQRGVKVVFIGSVFIISMGYILEIIPLSRYTSTLLINNIVSLSITLIGSMFYLYGKKNLKISYFLIIYTALGNVLYGTFGNEFIELRLNFFLRDSLFVMLLLTLAALLINKRHALIISAIYLLAAIAITIISDNFFMKNSIFLIVVGVGGYGIMIRYFVGILVETIHELEENSVVIKKQSTLLKMNNKELTNLNKTKDRFMSILAHDLRNPFNTILGFSEVLLAEFDKFPDSMKKNYLHLIQTTAEKTYNLLNKLLEWYQSQSGAIAYNPEKITLDKLLFENMNLLSESARNKNISMKNNLMADNYIFADKNMVNTIVRNLISNAIKFTSQNGNITASCFKKKDFIEIEISDTGFGIDKKDLDNLFKIDGVQSKNGTLSETGSGLGLLLCKEFAEKCGGQISATSELGKGSVFSVSFPCMKSM